MLSGELTFVLSTDDQIKIKNYSKEERFCHSFLEMMYNYFLSCVHVIGVLHGGKVI